MLYQDTFSDSVLSTECELLRALVHCAAAHVHNERSDVLAVDTSSAYYCTASSITRQVSCLARQHHNRCGDMHISQ